MITMNRRRKYKRGYPVAILVGFEADHVLIWHVFSRVLKQFIRLDLEGKRTDKIVLYNFNESIVKALKPILKEGIRTVVITTPLRTRYAKDFLEHIREHHWYLLQSKNPNSANFAELVGSASNRIAVTELIKTQEFIDLIAETTSKEADQAIKSLDEHLSGMINKSVVLYTLKEIEDYIYAKEKSAEIKTENLLLTNKYLSENNHKNRIHRLLQIAKNKNIKTRIINAETSAGTRINQFGGIVFFSSSNLLD